MELISMLTEQLGVSEHQAKGGSGLLFKLAKDQLNNEEFGQIAKVVPHIESLMQTAPPKEDAGMVGMLGGFASSLGGDQMATIGTLAQLAGGFKSLDLDPTMIQKFAPIIMTFLQSEGGEQVKSLLKKAIQ
ncbi:DUF2780 domain-containing protein [[Limnothrix rosea] IAM M-220]|uniref:DUF2780 domain-containing protein n=1 Tax=[Limnothrix rosea] IAM M-220 TaxID=454133 RepID=UPI000967DF3B|nr:DUF2780 domain-containing protein [[Limnothrix rosea] IAM M-220]OKH19101.1 hypothetical protein NIES208_03795 [[Limnothrix rosea] IAM M-220]